MRSSQITQAGIDPVASVFTRNRQAGHVKMKVEIGVMLQKPPEATRGEGVHPPPEPLGGA